jgi:hypothetical protein
LASTFARIAAMTGGSTGHEKDALALAAQQTSPAVKVQALLGVILGKSKAKLPKQESPK